MRAFAILACLALGLTLSQGYIQTPLIGYQQGVKLAILPSPSTNDQCTVYGVPTPYGYAPSAPTPLYLYTPSNTGVHTVEFSYDTSKYTLSPFLAPGQTILQIDATNAQAPIISFDASRSPLGQSGYITVYLSDRATGQYYCYSQIQLYVDNPLSCLPNYGGVYTPGVVVPTPPPVLPGGGSGTVIVIPPAVQIFAPVFVQQTIINQFVQVNNIQITNVVTNVNVIQNTTNIINVVNNPPPTPPPVNCTTTPTNPACTARPTPAPTTRPGPPTSGPTPAPTGTARPGPGSAPPPTTPVATPPTTVRPPGASPPTPSTPSATPAGQPPAGTQTTQPPARSPGSAPPPPPPPTTTSGRRLHL